MAELVADCPRCNAKKITFELIAAIPIKVKYNWQQWLEAFCVCRNCFRSTVFVLSQKETEDARAIEKGLPRLEYAANRHVEVQGFICIRELASTQPPDHLPPDIESAFREGAACLSIDCINAAATMFRLCIDLATTAMLPQEPDAGPNSRIRRSLGLRLAWLLDRGILPKELSALSQCVKDHGDDGAHHGTLTKGDAEDLLDFAFLLLTRIYTEPARLEEAEARTRARREGTTQEQHRSG